MNNYRLCGISGHNIDAWYRLGIREPLSSLLLTYQQALLNVEKDRCDILLTWPAQLLGNAQFNSYEIPEEITYKVLYEHAPTTFHVFFSKESPRGKELLILFNQKLKELQDEGIVKEIYLRFIPIFGDGY